MSASYLTTQIHRTFLKNTKPKDVMKHFKGSHQLKNQWVMWVLLASSPFSPIPHLEAVTLMPLVVFVSYHDLKRFSNVAYMLCHDANIL